MAAELPSLADLDLDIARQRIMLGTAGLAEPVHDRGRALADGFVRRTCRMVVKYERARAAALEFKEGQLTRPFLELQDSLEGTVHDLHRSLQYLQRLRNSDARGKNGMQLVPKANKMNHLNAAAENRIRQFRDDIEHLDNDIATDKAMPGWLVGVAIDEDAMRIGECRITFLELARWIRELFEIAEGLGSIAPFILNPVPKTH